MTEPTSDQTVPEDTFDENPYDEINRLEERAEEEPTEELDLPDDEVVLEELPSDEPARGGVFRTDSADSFTRSMPVRWGLADNPSRGSRRLLEPKSLTIVLPGTLAQLFGGAWIGQRGEDVFLSLFARSDQRDRSGYKVGSAWKWYKIKPHGEIVIGVSRGYVKSRGDDVMVHDYGIGAFRLRVPFDAEDDAAETGVEDRPAHSPMLE
jgi:hypothetical protein